MPSRDEHWEVAQISRDAAQTDRDEAQTARDAVADARASRNELDVQRIAVKMQVMLRVLLVAGIALLVVVVIAVFSVTRLRHQLDTLDDTIALIRETQVDTRQSRTVFQSDVASYLCEEVFAGVADDHPFCDNEE